MQITGSKVSIALSNPQTLPPPFPPPRLSLTPSDSKDGNLKNWSYSFSVTDGVNKPDNAKIAKNKYVDAPSARKIKNDNEPIYCSAKVEKRPYISLNIFKRNKKEVTSDKPKYDSRRVSYQQIQSEDDRSSIAVSWSSANDKVSFSEVSDVDQSIRSAPRSVGASPVYCVPSSSSRSSGYNTLSCVTSSRSNGEHTTQISPLLITTFNTNAYKKTVFLPQHPARPPPKCIFGEENREWQVKKGKGKQRARKKFILSPDEDTYQVISHCHWSEIIRDILYYQIFYPEISSLISLCAMLCAFAMKFYGIYLDPYLV